MTLAFGLALLLNFGPKFDFYTNGPYDPSVPKPETVLGYGPGERHTPFRDQELTLNAIAGKAGGRPTTIENSQYWIGPQIIVAQALKSRFRGHGRNWDFKGRSAEICALDWKGP